MIDTKRLAELRNGPMKGAFSANCACDDIPHNELLDTLEAALKVVEAAKDVMTVVKLQDQRLTMMEELQLQVSGALAYKRLNDSLARFAEEKK